MKKLIPLFTTILLSVFTFAQSPIETFEVDIQSLDCQGVKADFRIEGSHLDWDSLIWHFGDGAIYKGVNSNSKSHNYSTPGVYSVSLDIWLDGVEKTLTRDSLIVVPKQMNVSFDVVAEDTLMMAPATLHFINQTTPGNSDSISFKWEITPGNLYFYEKDLEYTFEKPGTYFLRLTAVDSLNCQSGAFETIDIKDTAQHDEFPYIVSSCQYSDISMEDFKKNFEIIHDTLFIYGIIDRNCCTEKTATYRIQGDTVYIQTWEAGEPCTCNCPFKFRIVIPDIGKDSVYVYFDSDLFLAKSLNSGIDNIEIPDFKIFPNPVQTYFTIQSPTLKNEYICYEITSLDGKKLQGGYAQAGLKVYINRSVKNAGFVAIKARAGKSETVFKVAIRK